MTASGARQVGFGLKEVWWKVSEMEIRLLGVGSIDLLIESKYHVYIDSFNTMNAAPVLHHDDIVLFTHADGDHFSVDSMVSSYKGNTIIGPPSIVLPLLKTGKVNMDRLIIEYPEQKTVPKSIDVGEVKIFFYQSEHFIGWNPIHCSYLIQYRDANVFVTGDSLVDSDALAGVGINCLVCNLVDKGYITKSDDPRYAVHRHMSYLVDILSKVNPDKIIASHLIGFDGTIEPGELKKLVTEYGFERIIVPESHEERIVV